MRLLKWIGLATLMAFVAAAPATLTAQPPAEECGQVSDGGGGTKASMKECTNEILDEQELLIDAVEDLVIEMQAMGSLSLTRERSEVEDDLEARIQSLRDEHGRARGANNDIEELDYEDMIASVDKEKGGKCVWMEEAEVTADPLAFLPRGLSNPSNKLGDGDCNAFDAFDDLRNKPVKVHERNENLCERVCEDKPGKKENRKQRLVGRMTGGKAATQRATERIQQQTQSLASLRLMSPDLGLRLSSSQSLAQVPAICAPIFEIPIPVPIDLAAMGVLTVAIGAGKIVTEALDLAKDGAIQACNQDVAGFNVSSSCMPFVVAFHISNGIVEVLAVARDAIEIGGNVLGSFQTDAILNCVQSIKEDTQGTSAGVDEIKADIVKMKSTLTTIQSVVEQNRQLLLTPHGQRKMVPLPQQ